MAQKILVWLSGGVDSAVAAHLLKSQWHDVSGGFMVNYLTDDDSCPTRIDMAAAREVANFLEIPFFTFDFVEEYESRVLKYLFDGYTRGITPNPDVFCNTWIKFDLFREEALSAGFDAVATGHYARIEREPNMQLLRWVDPEKDQSYFLAGLSREQLEQTIFPIGHLLKSGVRRIAHEQGLPNAWRKDSQGLCFVGKVNFAEFLKLRIPRLAWAILDTSWKAIGEHDGAFQYTIGQRRGIGIGGGAAWFVVAKDTGNNTITVGHEDDPRLFQTTCHVQDLHWLSSMTFPCEIEAQIRYRQAPQRVIVSKESEKTVVTFAQPQRAITPGQVCVFYDGEVVLGSGIIAW